MRVLLFGTFDGLHPGHQFVLNEAKKRGDLHVVIARDTHVEEIKGKRPKYHEQQRAHAVQHAFPDVQVLLGDAQDYLVPVRRIQPDLILLGYDQQLPPGVKESDFPCVTERLPSFQPDKWKSSLLVFAPVFINASLGLI